MHISKLLAPALLLTASQGAMAVPDFSGGVFIMNEEQSGNPGNGSINFFNPKDGNWSYRIFRQKNAGKEIPGAICHAHFFGGYLFIVSNHPSTPGSYDMTGTLTVLDGTNLLWLNSVELVNKHGKPVQGRCAFAMDDHGTSFGEINVLITTTDGILTYNVASGTLKEDPDLSQVAVSPDGTASPQPFQYPYQTGSIARAGETIFIASQSDGVIILPLQRPWETSAWSIETMFNGVLPDGLSADNGIGSVVMSNDGDLWMSVTADKNATGTAAPVLIRYDVETNEFSAVPVPEGIYPPANSWYAWTADGFHASATENALYWNGGADTWFSNSNVFKYDIDNGTFSKVMDLDAEAIAEGAATPWKIYGCSMRTSPVNGEMFLSLFKDYGLQDYTLRRLDADGAKIADYPMTEDSWFPALPVFPDLENPVLKPFEELVIPTDKATRIDLMGAASDPDSPDAGIIYSIKDKSHPGEGHFNLRHDGRSVTIYPNGVEPEENAPALTQDNAHEFPAECWIDIRASSQGFTDVRRLKFKFATAGLDATTDDIVAKAYVAGKELHLRNDGKDASIAYIFTPEGRAVLTIEAPAGESTQSLADLPAGLYLLRFGSVSSKFRL